jgi:hypothetical protein
MRPKNFIIELYCYFIYAQMTVVLILYYTHKNHCLRSMPLPKAT